MPAIRALAIVGLVCFTRAALSGEPDRSAQSFHPDQFGSLHRLIKPQAGEARWEAVPWMLSSDIWAARRKAAEEGKPLLLWYMAGEPLGTC
jgi:hypothetical protein